MATLFANWKPGRAEGSTVRAEDLAAALREGRPVRLDGATVEGELDLDGLEYPHRLVLTHNTFLGHVHLNDARFRHTVDLSGCEFRDGVNFFATRVDGQLKLAKVRILRGGRPPVRHNFDQLQVTGRLTGTQLHSEVSLSFRQARLGEIGFDGLRVDGDLDLQIARVTGDFFFKAIEGARSEVTGSVRLAGLQVGGHVELCGIRIGGGLGLGNADIREDFRCSTAAGFRTEILGLVSLAGARIGGVAHFGGARIGPPLPDGEPVPGHILALHGAEIGRGLRVCPHGEFRPEIRGGVFATSARIHHIALFDRAVIAGDLDFQRAMVDGRMLCAFDREFYHDRPDAPEGRMPGRLEVRGRLDLSGAQVQELVLDGRLFDPPEGLPADDARRRRRERRRDFFRRLLAPQDIPEERDARLSLDRTRLSKLTLQERVPDRISADGMVFDDLELPACGGECEYTELLRRTRPFKRSTYLAVEAWLRNKGLDEAAKRVYIEMSARDLVTGHSSRLSRWVKWLFLGVGIGYGARPQRLFWLFLAVFVLSCWVFSHPGALVSYNERLASQPEALSPGAGNTWMTLGVALRCHFPMLLFLGDPNYVPSSATIPGLDLTYSGYALLISAISWVMVPLFLAGLTGIVRQRQ